MVGPDVTGRSPGRRPVPALEGQAVQRWEHKVVRCPLEAHVEPSLEAAGANGWELVSVDSWPGENGLRMTVLYLKRPASTGGRGPAPPPPAAAPPPRR